MKLYGIFIDFLNVKLSTKQQHLQIRLKHRPGNFVNETFKYFLLRDNYRQITLLT